MDQRKIVFVATLISVAIVACQQKGATKQEAGTPAETAMTAQERVERGHYLVVLGGCNDCHTPWKMTDHGPRPDSSRYLSGHPEDAAFPDPPVLGPGPWGVTVSLTFTAWSGPWGTSFSANLTPDSTRGGMGVWTEDMFLQAMRNGKHMATSRPILPPMPWENYGKMTDEDLKAVYAYLRSIPPIPNQVPEPIPPPGS